MDSPGTDFDALLTRGAIGILVLTAAWSLVVVAAVALEVRTRGRVRLAERAGCPPVVRVWLLAAFVAVFAGIAPVNASDTGSGPAVPSTALDGLPLPDRVTGPAGSPAGLFVVVRPGDSLWRIARDLLPPRARDADVAAAVTHLYAANRDLIGPDPDLLLPGQRLLVDDPDTHPEAP